jgi:hypothetical protein
LGTTAKLGAGTVLSVLGGIGGALAPTLGATALGRPWSFLAGFVFGLMAGTGVVLAISGLIERKDERAGG